MGFLPKNRGFLRFYPPNHPLKNRGFSLFSPSILGGNGPPPIFGGNIHINTLPKTNIFAPKNGGRGYVSLLVSGRVSPRSPRPNKEWLLRMIHVKDSRSYQRAKLGRLFLLPGYPIYPHGQVLLFIFMGG